MSDVAAGRARWARPGAFHDRLVGVLKILLPATVGLVLAFLALAPLERGREVSFLLDKHKVDVAGERMRVQSARYRGVDAQGRPFTLDAGSAVQATSTEPVVEIRDMGAEIRLDEGPARVTAGRATYDMATDLVDVVGAIQFTAADGYRIETRDVLFNLRERTMFSRGPVEGQLPLGRFTAGRLEVDLPERRAVLSGRARLHIVQGALR
jgi:lipopolysaccharide export system protein LptC